MNKQNIIRNAYKEFMIDYDNTNFIDFFTEPIHVYIVENSISDLKLKKMYLNNMDYHSTHLKNISVDSAILFTNKYFKINNYSDMSDMLKNMDKIDFINEFYSLFDSLFELVVTYIMNNISNYKSVYKILDVNRDSLKYNYNLNFRDLTNINPSFGDRHINQIPTTRVEYGSEIYFFKDKSFLYEDMFNEVFSLLDNEYKFEKSLKLDRGYLQKSVPYTNPINKKNIYKNAGKLIFVSYLLGTTDFHFENLIFHNDYFVPIDCETIFQIDSFYPPENLKINYNLKNSVAHTSLLPFKSTNGYVLSAFSSYDKPLFNNDVSITINQKSVTPKYGINKESLSDEKLSANLIPKDFYQMQDYVIEGFNELYNKYLLNKKDSVNNFIKVRFNKVKSRTIHKGTYYYYELLKKSFHPYLFLSNERNKFIENMGLNDLEEKSLKNNYIPIDFKNICIDNSYFDKFSIDDLKLQNVIIRQCFIAEKSYFQKINNTVHSHILENKDIENSFINILKSTILLTEENIYILDFIITGNEDSGFNYEVILLPRELYIGTSGIAIYLMNYLKIHEDSFLYKSLYYIYTDLIKYIRRSINSEDISLGYFDGISGIIHILIRINNLFKEISILEIQEWINFLYSYEMKNKQSGGDVINGTLGFIYFLTICSMDKNLYIPKEYINNISLKYCNDNPNKSLYNGFAHGIAGEIFIFSLVNDLLHNKKIQLYIDNLLNTLNSNFIPEQNNWYISTEDSTTPLNWCHGSPGIILNLPLLFDKNKIDVLDKIIQNITGNNSKNLCLCHGKIGNLWILDFVYKNHGLLKNYDIEKYRILLKEEFKYMNIFQYNKSFMLGLSGILSVFLYPNEYKNFFM